MAAKFVPVLALFGLLLNPLSAQEPTFIAGVPRWDATPHDPEAAKEYWLAALDRADADPALSDAQRAEVAQLRTALGLEPRPGPAAGVAVALAAGLLFVVCGRKPQGYAEGHDRHGTRRCSTRTSSETTSTP